MDESPRDTFLRDLAVAAVPALLAALIPVALEVWRDLRADKRRRVDDDEGVTDDRGSG